MAPPPRGGFSLSLLPPLGEKLICQLLVLLPLGWLLSLFLRGWELLLLTLSGFWVELVLSFPVALKRGSLSLHRRRGS